jgi:tRNA-specific 2-thiouridylase
LVDIFGTVWYKYSDMKHETTAKKLKICVGMSGGVDSSVTAALLKQQGHDVVGVYMKNWNDESPTLGEHQLSPDEYRMACPWYDDYLDAKRVAMQLDIPFYMWDFRESYKKKVFDHFIDEFAKGRTPNPDVYCNSRVKFEDFQQRALTELQVDYVATGHYARVAAVETPVGIRYELQMPKDVHKDQTYFLYRLSQEQLSKALFPLADYTKPEIRELAKQFNLATKYKKDSQGICFIGQVDVREFIAQWLKPKQGPIIDLAGNQLGIHTGVHFHTIGEKIAVDNALVVKHSPELRHDIPIFYIVKKDMVTNTLTVVPGVDHPALYANVVTVEDVHWTVGAPDLSVDQLTARYRHGGQRALVEKIEQTDQGLTITFAERQRALTPGQHLVLYRDAVVVGGGVIIQAAD